MDFAVHVSLAAVDTVQVCRKMLFSCCFLRRMHNTNGRDHGIRGRSRMTKRQLLEALEAVGVHETLQPAQRVVKNSIEK